MKSQRAFLQRCSACFGKRQPEDSLGKGANSLSQHNGFLPTTGLLSPKILLRRHLNYMVSTCVICRQTCPNCRVCQSFSWFGLLTVSTKREYLHSQATLRERRPRSADCNFSCQPPLIPEWEHKQCWGSLDLYSHLGAFGKLWGPVAHRVFKVIPPFLVCRYQDCRAMHCNKIRPGVKIGAKIATFTTFGGYFGQQRMLRGQKLLYFSMF